MANKKKVLLVAQEMKPYTNVSEMSKNVYEYAQFLQKKGMEVRILMPRFGTINERRHRLHEVVRLSGMNITVGEDDYPLIIKVASLSLPGTRMQVYFLDNEDFFKRKQVFVDGDGNFLEDNQERMIFFCKGVIETVKKFGWAPDLVHCFGWMTSLLPAYLKQTYKNEPIFKDSSLIYSASDCSVANKAFEQVFEEKVAANGLGEVGGQYYEADALDLNKGAAQLADGLIIDELMEGLDNEHTLVLDGDENFERCMELYQEFLVEA